MYIIFQKNFKLCVWGVGEWHLGKLANNSYETVPGEPKGWLIWPHLGWEPEGGESKRQQGFIRNQIRKMINPRAKLQVPDKIEWVLRMCSSSQGEKSNSILVPFVGRREEQRPSDLLSSWVGSAPAVDLWVHTHPVPVRTAPSSLLQGQAPRDFRLSCATMLASCLLRACLGFRPPGQATNQNPLGKVLVPICKG